MSDELPLLRSPLLSAISRVRHGFSTRDGGVSAAPFDSLHLGSSPAAAPDDVRENRRRFAAARGLMPEAPALGEQRQAAPWPLPTPAGPASSSPPAAGAIPASMP